jgi:hypothetical protein
MTYMDRAGVLAPNPKSKWMDFDLEARSGMTYYRAKLFQDWQFMLILDSVVTSASYEGNITVPNHPPDKSTRAKIWSTVHIYSSYMFIVTKRIRKIEIWHYPSLGACKTG